MSVDLARLMADAIGALEEAHLDYALMGGGARNAYAEPRATRDVDFVVAVDETKHPALVDALARRGFVAATSTGERDEIPDLTLFRDPEGRRIDVLFAHTDFERSALARSRPQEPYEGVVTPVVSVEDLVVYKLLADRPHDRADIEDVIGAVRARGGSVDWSYIEAWCDAWEIRARLERLRRALAP